MPQASLLCDEVSAALSAYGGATSNLITGDLSASGPPTYGDMQMAGAAALLTLQSAIGAFRTTASLLGPVMVTWRNVEQPVVTLADRLAQLIDPNIVACLNDTDAADAANAFAAAKIFYVAMGQ